MENIKHTELLQIASKFFLAWWIVFVKAFTVFPQMWTYISKTRVSSRKEKERKSKNHKSIQIEATE